MLVMAAAGDVPARPADCGSVPPAEPVTRSLGMMLVGMTPSTHDGRRKLLTGVDGGELAGETEMRSGAEPLRFDAATDVPQASSSDGLMPTEARGGNYLPEPPYLRETKTYHRLPLESIRYAGNYFVPLSIRPIFIFLLQKLLCQIT